MLTEDFESILQERGIRHATANWSLGYCQGDGVCFTGTVDIAEVIRLNRLKEFKDLAEWASADGASAKILNGNSRYCHWNSMTVEMELYGGSWDLYPPELIKELRRYEEQCDQLRKEYQRAWAEVKARNVAPIREWQRLQARWLKNAPKDPQDWSPRIHPPGPEPAELTEPYPPQPECPEPAPVSVSAKEEAEARWKALEILMNEFETWLIQWVKDLSKELEKIGYAEIEYRRSDEAIIEFFNGNEWEFLEDGGRWKG